MPRTIEKTELPRMVPIVEVKDEADDVRTLWLAQELDFQPGQFVMLWIPRLDEKPYTLSATAPGRAAVTVRRRGPFSERLFRMKPGESVGLRGPYGKGFIIKRPGVIVAGGCGLATLAPLKDAMPDAILICGATSADGIMFQDRFPDMVVCTDDGSAGRKGFPTEVLKEHLDRREARAVYTCGPEVMMRAVFDLCEKYRVECQAGLERYMKCGIGVCGQCACGDKLVCLDGPVFNSDELRTMGEFGRTARLKSGRRVTVEEYAK